MSEVNQALVESIKKVLALELPCEVSDEHEILCDDCPFNLTPGEECGLALAQERGKATLKEMGIDE